MKLMDFIRELVPDLISMMGGLVSWCVFVIFDTRLHITSPLAYWGCIITRCGCFLHTPRNTHPLFCTYVPAHLTNSLHI